MKRRGVLIARVGLVLLNICLMGARSGCDNRAATIDCDPIQLTLTPGTCVP